jgi:DNA methylase
MARRNGHRFLRLSDDAQAAFIAAARDSRSVRGLTHDFYKYPARFSPVFARSAIELFTKPGDLVLDPHVGGGTTLVEARAAGREGLGIDISALAQFVAQVKCTVFSELELQILAEWSEAVEAAIDIHKPSTPITEYVERGYYKHRVRVEASV